MTVSVVTFDGQFINQTINLTVDNTGPLAFSVTSTAESWSNNNCPTVTFATTDATSGVDHYELTLDNAAPITVTSPYQFPAAIPDGVHQLVINAFDKAGNMTTGHMETGDDEIYIDTTPPQPPQNLRVIPGNGKMEVQWDEPDQDVVQYRLERAPEETAGDISLTARDYSEGGLTNGTPYKYRVWAIDHANNTSQPTDWIESIIGVGVAPYTPDQGAVVQYDNVTLTLPQTGMPDGVSKVEVTEATSQHLADQTKNISVGPIYEFSAFKDGEDTPEENLAMPAGQSYIGAIHYDPSLVPQGFPEQNLGVYYYDPMFDRWFQVQSSGVDTQNKVIYFLTNHFSSFSVQATVIQDLSPQEYKDAGYSPLHSYSQSSGISVSPQGGTASASVTELVLPGRNGFDFVLKRHYDTATAREDAFALGINGRLGINLVSPGTSWGQLGSLLISFC